MCVDRMGGVLLTLLDLYAESDQALAPASPMLRERVSGSRSSVGIVLDERAVELRARAAEVLRLWARLVLDERGGTGPGSGEPGVRALVRFLRGQLPWFAGHPAGVDLDDELTELRAAFGGLLGPGPVRRFALGPCTRPECTGTLHGVLAAGGGVPGHVSCDAGHALPPRQWLLVADRVKEAARS